MRVAPRSRTAYFCAMKRSRVPAVLALLALAAAVAPFLVTFVGRRTLSDSERPRRGRVLDLSEGETYVRLDGPEDGPPVLLVHGLAAGGFVWDTVAARLARAGFRVIRPDLYGRGWSARPFVSYDLDLFVDQLAEVLDALGLHGPVDVAGLSMGGLVSASLAARHPGRVRRLALLCPAGFDAPVPLATRLAEIPVVGEWVMATFGHLIVKAGIRRAFHDTRAMAPFKASFGAQLRVRGYRRAILSTLRAVPLHDAESTFRRMARTARPLLVLWGREDRVVPVEAADRARQVLPDAEIEIRDGVGHTLPVEQPDWVADRLRGFFSDAEVVAAEE
jgi:pimeloyl-ACP methyl ester carboxylesterase